MSEEMTFLPRAQLLSLEEMTTVARCFTELGVNKIRITGGEPLIRSGVISLFRALGKLPLLDELTLTTNGSHLGQHAQDLRDAGVKRVNISLDSLQPGRFKALTRTGDLSRVLKGINAAKQAGFERIKLNTVVLRNRNADEVVDLVRFALQHELDISFIEEMPLGNISEHNREQEFCSSEELREIIGQTLPLQATTLRSNGPSRYWTTPGHDTRIGFISPHSENFCSSCNRVRLSAEGQLLLCLGNEDALDLKKILRAHPGDRDRVKDAIVKAISFKPERHHFQLDDEPQIVRFMNATGG